MGDFSSAIVEKLAGFAGGKVLNVGIFYSGNQTVVTKIIQKGHRVVVLGNNFRQLNQLQKIVQDRENTIIVETALDGLPIGKGKLDVLVFSGGLPDVASPVQFLHALGGLLSCDGLLIWPHSFGVGVLGRLGKILAPHPRGTMKVTGKHEHCNWAMLAGLKDVGQEVASTGMLTEWVVTFGQVGKIWIA